MKQDLLKRISALILCVVMVTTVFAAMIPVHAASNVSVQNGTGTRTDWRVNETYSYRAIVNGEFTAFGYVMPTWTKTDSYATLALYNGKVHMKRLLPLSPSLPRHSIP